MSGPGDVGGEVSGEEAAWRDLVARYDAPAQEYAEAVPWPEREDLARPVEAETTSESTGSLGTEDTGLADSGSRTESSRTEASRTEASRTEASGSYTPVDRTRVIRQAGDPRSYTPPEEEDEPYIPEPLPPPAKLDTVAKAAWTCVIGGPAYLLIAWFLHWIISGVAAFAAVAAFVGGFATLVVRGGNKPRRDDDDDGAVL